MSFEEVARKRRTVHKYEPSEVEHELVLRALSSALLAPNHRHTFPWSFVVVGPETRTQLAERVFEIKKKQNPEIGEEQRQAGLDSYLRPAGLVVFAQKRSESEFQRREDYATMACSIQNFTLVMAEEDIGTKWSTASFMTDPEFYRILGLVEAEVEIVGLLWFGKAAGELAEQRRPYLSDVMTVLP
jgi:nitroreductase